MYDWRTHLQAEMADSPWRDHAGTIVANCEAALDPARHGDLPRWLRALSELPPVSPGWRVEQGRVIAGRALPEHHPELERALQDLMPWRKGPFELGGVRIDTEWRSDWKWDRVQPHLDLAGRNVLDVGAGNGYFGWRMLQAGARRVVACDPTLLFVMQHHAVMHCAGPAPNHLLPLRLEDLPPALDGFDTVFSMGVLYHRRDHLAHLADLRARLKPGGRLVLETLVLPDGGDDLLRPQGRYARMRNVHAIPAVPVLLDWVAQAGFAGARVLDITATGCDEQRSTAWMPFESLDKALDPRDPSRTVEGHPAPTRVVVVATVG